VKARGWEIRYFHVTCCFGGGNVQSFCIYGQFLSNIRNTDAVIHVVRCFTNDDVIHVDGTVDPERDAEIIGKLTS
jgi:hypothetical protein